MPRPDNFLDPDCRKLPLESVWLVGNHIPTRDPQQPAHRYLQRVCIACIGVAAKEHFADGFTRNSTILCRQIRAANSPCRDRRYDLRCPHIRLSTPTRLHKHGFVYWNGFDTISCTFKDLREKCQFAGSCIRYAKFSYRMHEPARS